MKKTLIGALILSSVLLTSCGSENVARIENQDIKKERLEVAKKEYSNYKTNLNKGGKIDIKSGSRKLEFKGITCDNILPFYEYKINWYNDSIGYYDMYGTKYGKKTEIDEEKDIGMYDEVLLSYNSYIKLISKGKDDNDICIYSASINNYKGDEIIAMYKDGIFEYKTLFDLEGLEKKSTSGTSFGGGKIKNIEDLFDTDIENYGIHLNDTYKDGTAFAKSIILDKNNISSYLDYLFNSINYLEEGVFNYKPHKVESNGINLQ